MPSALAFMLLVLSIGLLNGKRLSSCSPCLECLSGGGEAVSVCCNAAVGKENRPCHVLLLNYLPRFCIRINAKSSQVVPLPSPFWEGTERALETQLPSRFLPLPALWLETLVCLSVVLISPREDGYSSQSSDELMYLKIPLGNRKIT